MLSVRISSAQFVSRRCRKDFRPVSSVQTRLFERIPHGLTGGSFTIRSPVLITISRIALIQWPDGRLVRFELAIDVTQRKQTETSLRRITELLNTAQRLARIGGWEWTIGTSTMYWSDEVYRIHGLDPLEIQPGSKKHIDHSLDCYVPGDRERVQKAFEACCEVGEPYDLECDFVDFSGRTKRVRTRAEAVLEDERVLKVIGTIMDVTSTKLDSLTS